MAVDIHEFCDQFDTPQGVFYLGHLADVRFRRMVKVYLEETDGLDPTHPSDQGLIQQIKSNPIWRGYWREHALDPPLDGVVYQRVSRGARGAFAVTVMDICW